MHDGNESLLRGSIRLVFCLNSSIYYFYAIEDLCQKEVSMRSNVKGKYIRNFLIKKIYIVFGNKNLLLISKHSGRSCMTASCINSASVLSALWRPTDGLETDLTTSFTQGKHR